MFSSGLILLSLPISQVLKKIGSYLSLANKSITNTLYITIEPINLCFQSNLDSNKYETSYKVVTKQDLIRVVPQIYEQASLSAPNLDVRVLHPLLSTSKERHLQFTPQIVFTNQSNHEEDLMKKYLSTNYGLDYNNGLVIKSIDSNEIMSDSIDAPNSQPQDTASIKMYDRVCLGGTFDNLHNGHKVLLSEAQLRCSKSLTIGVTDVNMIQSKLLWELIEPLEERMAKLKQYVMDVDSGIEYKITPIQDPFGPAIEDKDLECIVVSQETIRGGNKINEIRREKGMSELDVDVVHLVNETNKESSHEESKISSSSARMRKLGNIIRAPKENLALPKKPYIIGLTGGIASGKSSIAEKLSTLGAGIINCDFMAHQTYQSPTSPVYNKIVETFGQDIINKENGSIDRSKLRRIVFSDANKLKVLNGIVWPELNRLVMQKIDEMKDTHNVIVLEIALLLEAGWQEKVHQIWVAIIDEKEAIKRLKERSGLEENEAKNIISFQMSNHEKVQKANIVLCTYWDHEFTMKQVTKAWNQTQKYL